MMRDGRCSCSAGPTSNAEVVGFEPTEPEWRGIRTGSPEYKSSAISHSATPPLIRTPCPVRVGRSRLQSTTARRPLARLPTSVEKLHRAGAPDSRASHSSSFANEGYDAQSLYLQSGRH